MGRGAMAEARVQLKGFPEPVTFYRSGSGGPGVTLEAGGGGTAPRLGFGALAFALLGTPCAAVAALSPVALWLGIGTAASAGSLSLFGFLDRPWIRVPVMVLAALGAVANLAAAHRASRLRRTLPRGGFLPPSNTDRRRTRWALALSGLTLLILLAELVAHAHLHPHP